MPLFGARDVDPSDKVNKTSVTGNSPLLTSHWPPHAGTQVPGAYLARTAIAAGSFLHPAFAEDGNGRRRPIWEAMALAEPVLHLEL